MKNINNLVSKTAYNTYNTRNIKKMYDNLSQKSIYNYNKKYFIIKYLIKNKYIKLNDSYNQSDKSIKEKKLNAIDLNELLDDRNIKLTFSDILHDKRCFRKAYMFASNKKLESMDIDYLNNKKDIVELPFNEKDISFTKVYKYYMFKGDRIRNNNQYIYFLIIFYTIAAFVYFKYKLSVQNNIKLSEKYRRSMEKEVSDNYNSLINNNMTSISQKNSREVESLLNK